MRESKRGRYVVATALILVLGAPAVAVGFGEGRNLKAGDRNPSSRSLTSETEIIASNGTYGTRQSNKRDGDGGGAIYGCRSNPGSEPCIRSNNLKGGRAFEFSTVGKEAGRIEVGDATGPPLTTNATGVATGLNADKVDGQDATAFVASNRLLFAAVTAEGRSSSPGVTNVSRAAATNTYVVAFSRDVSGCSFSATRVADTANEQGVAVAGGGDPTNVRVDFTGTNPVAFHLQIVCG